MHTLRWWIFAFLAVFLPPLLRAEELSVTLKSITEVRTSEASGNELRLWLRLQASGLQNALEYRDVRIVTARDDTGADLAPVRGEDEPTPASKLARGTGEGAPSVLLPVVLRPATRPARQITELSGRVTLRVFRRQVVLLNDVIARTGKAAQDPLFKAHNLEVFITDPVQGTPGLTDPGEIERLRARAISIRFSGEISQALEVDLVSGDGEPIPARSTSFGGGRSALFTLTADRPLPAGAQARVTIPTTPQEIEVPFALKNIPLP
jgi:hypothetical protein